MAQVLRQQHWLSELRSSRNTLQSFNVRITTKFTQINPSEECRAYRAENNNAERQAANETFMECDVVQLSVKAEKEAYLVVFDLTFDGKFSLLYPFLSKDGAKNQAGVPFQMDIGIQEPFGQDSIIAMAFSSAEDPLYKKIVKKWHGNKDAKIKPGQILHKQIVKRLTTPDQHHAQHIKNIITIQR